MKPVNGEHRPIIHSILCKSYFSGNVENKIIHRIALYATASTTSAAYIIGGAVREIGDSTVDYVFRRTSAIRAYENGKWRTIGILDSFRKSASSISNGDDTMVIGGATLDGGGR